MSESKSDADWGINLAAVHCPECKVKMPALRVPKNFLEMMWGGWTCPECGCRMDKWGKPRDAKSE